MVFSPDLPAPNHPLCQPSSLVPRGFSPWPLREVSLVEGFTLKSRHLSRSALKKAFVIAREFPQFLGGRPFLVLWRPMCLESSSTSSSTTYGPIPMLTAQKARVQKEVRSIRSFWQVSFQTGKCSSFSPVSENQYDKAITILKTLYIHYSSERCWLVRALKRTILLARTENGFWATVNGMKKQIASGGALAQFTKIVHHHHTRLSHNPLNSSQFSVSNSCPANVEIL